MSDIQSLQSKIINSGSDMEEFFNLYVTPWGNSIHKNSNSKTDKYTKKNGVFYSDFNDALDAYQDKNSDKLYGLHSDRDEINDLMKELSNPPKGLENHHAVIKALYDSYINSLALLNVSGSYNSMSADYNRLKATLFADYEKVKALDFTILNE